MIVDAHAHCNIDPNSEAGRDYYKDILHRMDWLGIDRMVVFHLNNEWTEELVTQYPDRFIPLVFLHPLDRNFANDLDYYVQEAGFKGVKMSPTGDWDIDYYPHDERAYPAYERIQELSVPLLYHSGVIFRDAQDPGRSRCEYCRPIFLDHIARDFPNLTLIVAHAGRPWVDDVVAMSICPNVFVDISWSQLPPEMLRSALEKLIPAFGPDRIMWGSDVDYRSPIWLTERFDNTIRTLERMEVGYRVIEKIMGESARELLGIAPQTRPSLEIKHINPVEEDKSR